MFTIYHSNQLDLLKTLISTLMAIEPLTNPFQKEVVVVQSLSVSQWLQMQLAENFGIAANIACLLPATFIWEMFIQVLPNIPKESAFSKDAMTWKIMWLLQDLLTLPSFKPLKYYLKENRDKRKLHQLSRQIADIFDQYLVYRPQWLESWQRGENIHNITNSHQWQPLLWARLVKYTQKLGQPACHRANLYSLFINTLNHSTHCPIGLPKRVFIFGISSLPPIYLDVLQALGRHIDIHLMFNNPCRFYWGDVQEYAFPSHLKKCKHLHSSKIQEQCLFEEPNKKECSLFNNELEKKIGNPILASFGKLGRDYLYLISQLEEIHEIDAFVDIPDDNMLHTIQRDILELEDHTVIGITPNTFQNSLSKRKISPQDYSISFHLCHSSKRELEVLHDQILTMLEEDLELKPRDIIVMIADIDRYIPYIQAVFGNAAADCYLPFTIIDSKAPKLHPILHTFISLINLLQSRFKAEEVLAFLELPELAMRFSIDKKKLPLLRNWITKSGIRWGLDDNNVRDLDLPETGQHTWKFGLTRMLLGYAMDSQSGDWNGILPYDESSGLDAELIGNLADLIDSLIFWRKKLSKMRSLKEWSPLCPQLLNTFFIKNGESEIILALIKQQWQQVISFGIAANYLDSIPFSMLQDDLMTHLNQNCKNQCYFSEKINFCTLMPMRSIPFKVVCLLGMNNRVYPRILPVHGFDLMAQQPKCGDRSRRDDDRYLFLEAILSAQKQLYISFIGRSIQDNRENYPSVLITELLEYLEQSYCLPGDEKLDTDSSAKRISNFLLNWHSRIPYAIENFLPGSNQQSYAATWLPAADRRGIASSKFNQSLLTLNKNQISLDSLRQFYRHPIRAFFQMRLGVTFTLEETKLPNEEPFTLDNFRDYKLNKQLLNTLIEDQNSISLFQRVFANGDLPFGAFGEIYWSKKQEDLIELANTVRTERSVDNKIELDINIDGIRLIGWLHQIQSDGLLRWRPTKLSAGDGMLLWLEHLVYCCAGGRGMSRLYGRKKTTWRFEALMLEDAKKYLSNLIAGYQYGLCQPLFLFKKSGWAWINQCYQPKTHTIDWTKETQIKAKEKFLQAWIGNPRFPGEREDYYLQRVFSQFSLNDDDLSKIFDETERYFLPLAQFNLN